MIRRDRSRERGIALLLVLWVFMILGTLALDFGRYMRDDAQAAINLADETRGYYLALAGMNRALFAALESFEQRGRSGRQVAPGARAGEQARAPDQEGAEEETIRPTPVDGQWHAGEFAGGHYEVRMTDEGGRIPINRVGPTLLTHVVTNLVTGGNRTTGVDRRTSADIQEVVESIVDWKDPDSLKRTRGAESDYYLSLRPPYRAKNGFIDSPEELLAVRGMTPALFYGTPDSPGLRDVVSVFNRSGFVNVRSVAPGVLQALLGVTKDRAEELTKGCGDLACLQKLQAEALAVDPRLVNRLGEEEPHTILVEARADTSLERGRATVAAIVELSGDELEGIRVLRWLDRAPWEGTLPLPPPEDEA